MVGGYEVSYIRVFAPERGGFSRDIEFSPLNGTRIPAISSFRSTAGRSSRDIEFYPPQKGT